MRMTAAFETEEQKQETLYLRMVESVHPAGMSETCESLFETRGYGPLSSFFQVEGGEAAFLDYGEQVCREVTTTLRGPGFSEGAGDSGDCLALFGHAVFLNAIAFIIACAAGATKSDQDMLLELDLGETQGILINLGDGSMQHMTTTA